MVNLEVSQREKIVQKKRFSFKALDNLSNLSNLFRQGSYVHVCDGCCFEVGQVGQVSQSVESISVFVANLWHRGHGEVDPVGQVGPSQPSALAGRGVPGISVCDVNLIAKT